MTTNGPKTRQISEDVIARTKARVETINHEVNQIVEKSSKDYKPIDLDGVSFQVMGCAPRRTVFLPEDEAIFNSFLRKLKSVPGLKNPILVLENDVVKIGNIENTKSLVSELRPVFFNQGDSIYFTKVHNKICQLLSGTYDGGQVKLTVHRRTATGDVDITKDFIAELNARKRIVLRSIEASDLDYLYNGVLQHSDSRFHEQHQREYLSGELNYTILKNAQLLAGLHECIDLYRPCLEMLWYDGFPTQGSL